MHIRTCLGKFVIKLACLLCAVRVHLANASAFIVRVHLLYSRVGRVHLMLASAARVHLTHEIAARLHVSALKGHGDCGEAPHFCRF